VPEYDTFEQPIADEVARVIRESLAADLELKSCEAGDLSDLPAPSEFQDALDKVLIISHGLEVTDLGVGSPQAAAPRPPGFEVVYTYELVFIRLNKADEDSHGQLADGSRRIKKLFLNEQRKLPSLGQPGCNVIRAVPSSSTPHNPYNDLYDVPEIGAKADVIWLRVFTRSLLR
jgi:hypothetical protein